MKKLFALAALVLGLASCQTEPEGFGVVTGGEVDTVVTVSLPAATRSSEQSGLENIDLENTYDLRYILEVYDAADNAFVIRHEQQCDDTTVTFPVRLIPSRDYYFVVWADFVKGDEACYNVESLKNVSIVKETWTAMNEARDAYTGVIKVEDYNGSKQIDDITLTRPFGKLRVVTTDMDALEDLNNSGLKSVKVTYTTQVGTAFNALYPAVTAPESNKVFTYNYDFDWENDTNGVYNESGNNFTLFADYIFVQGTATINFNMVVTYQDNKTSEVTFNTDIPVVRNQLTTIIGSILTDANDVKVVVDEEFAAKNTILDVFENGGEYTLTENIELPANNLIVKKDVVLNLGGYTINAGKPDSAEMTGTDIAAITVVDGATLTIEGNGTIKATEYGVYLKNGNVVIKGGNFVAGTSAVQVYNGTATIEGGKFEATKSDVYVVNCIDANWKNGTAKVAIKGGEFKNFNPANNAAEGVGTCFVAEGYFSRQVAENVYEVAELAGEITLESDIETAASLVVKEGTSAVLNLNGFDIINAGATEALGVADAIIVYGKLEINGNGTVKGNTRSVWARGNTNAEVTINGGNYVGAVVEGGCEVIYASGNGKITINGGTFEAANMDENSFAAPQYAVLNLHGNGAAGCDIKVYGGSFKNFNPADNISENPKHNFCAEGCYADADGDWFEVIYDPYRGYTKVADIDELKEAIKTANNKIVFLNDITGDVEISNAVNINGDGKTYTGKMKLTANKTDVTIKNVNFDGKGYNGYAIETRGVYYVTIEDCTAKNYGYGFVQLASSTVLTTVKNVTVSNMNYGVKVDYTSAIVLENANFNVNVAAVLNSNYGEKSITIKNSYLNILGTWTRNNTTKTNYVFEGNNSIDSFIIDAAIDNFKLAAGATLTAPNEINVTTDAGYTVEYADGKYISKSEN